MPARCEQRRPSAQAQHAAREGVSDEHAARDDRGEQVQAAATPPPPHRAVAVPVAAGDRAERLADAVHDRVEQRLAARLPSVGHRHLDATGERGRAMGLSRRR